MTIIKLKGGLGNQLFQYAFGRLTALRRGDGLKMDKDILGIKGASDKEVFRDYGLDHFNIKADLASAEEIKAAKYPYGSFSKAWRLAKAKALRIFHVGYEPRMLRTRSKYLDGYFQSHRYLDPIRSELLQEISLKEDLSAKYGAMIAEMGNSDSVAVHIRRGDYVSDAKTRQAYFVCDLPYYDKAISIMKEKIAAPVFYIFSDDIAWAKESLKEDRLVFVSRPDMKDYEEIILMSKCKHNIIANSSFSFWGAWLNQNPGKIVIGPRLWNRKFRSAYRNMMPDDWIKI